MGKGEEAVEEGRMGGGEEGRSEEKDGKGRNMYMSKNGSSV